VNASLSDGKEQLPLPWDAADPAARPLLPPATAQPPAALGPAPSYSEPRPSYSAQQPLHVEAELELDLEPDAEQYAELDPDQYEAFAPEPEAAPRRRFPRVDWEQVHMAMPRLLGQAAYTPPRRLFEPTLRPFDPDELPLEAERDEDPRFMAAAMAEAESLASAASRGVSLRLSDSLPLIGSFLRRSRS
jgi:hypothetical protein